MSSTVILANWDFNWNEVFKFRLQNLASDPSGVGAGGFYFNTAIGLPRFHNGTEWTSVGEPNAGVLSITPGDSTIVIEGTSNSPSVRVAKTLNSTWITDFHAQVRTNRLDQMAPPTAAVNMNGQKLSGLAQGTAPSDAVTLSQIPSSLPPSGAAGGDLSGAYPNPTLTNTTNVQTIVRSNRLDQMAAPATDVNWNGKKITGLAAPTLPQDAATKGYVDAFVQGLDFKQSVRTLATVNGAIATAFSNGKSVGGVTVATGDRIVLTGQTNAAENGIYTVSATGAPTRATDADATGELSKGSLLYVEEGTQAGQLWIVSNTSANPWQPGSSTSTWTQFAGAADIVAGSGLNKAGNTLSVKPGTGTIVDSNGVSIDTSVVTRKYSENINTAGTSYTVTHNLNTKDVTFSIRRISDDAFVLCSVIASTANTLTLGFATSQPANTLRVTVQG